MPAHTISQNREVPQIPYTSNRAFDPLPSIIFGENGSSGVNLGRALRNETNNLYYPDFEPALSVAAKKFTLRINWPGYLPWCGVLHAFDYYRRDAHPVTLVQLAHLVARKISLCLEDLGTEDNRSRATDPDWIVNNINFENLVLIRLEHVGKGSWQPVIAYRSSGTL
ncbi:hypothetical protein BDY19DRAFT_1053047 [Irpex rosettiformis]|uniref:Uncharacterized protein n=1 Tax=Irpex rosettiformis TaxID=378272 RepID=A0ACB8UGY9_9APHY|nr:hypothetical protein BDY19DRAFT_1053047 [Irpex rosettiformis]